MHVVSYIDVLPNPSTGFEQSDWKRAAANNPIADLGTRRLISYWIPAVASGIPPGVLHRIDVYGSTICMGRLLHWCIDLPNLATVESCRVICCQRLVDVAAEPFRRCHLFYRELLHEQLTQDACKVVDAIAVGNQYSTSDCTVKIDMVDFQPP